MSDATPLDLAHAAMEAAPDDDAARLGFYGRLVEGEMFLLLERELEGDVVEPRMFPLDEGPFVLVFDTEARLAEFAAGPAPYAAMPGRQVAALLAGQGIGMAINLGTAPSQMMLPGEAVDWLAETLGDGPAEEDGRIAEIGAPSNLPEALLVALDRTLSRSATLARLAYLAGVTYEGGRRGHLLAFIDAEPGSEPALARAVESALTFSGVEAGALDVAFFAPTDAIAARLARWGLRIDLPEPPQTVTPFPDPDQPPRLK